MYIRLKEHFIVYFFFPSFVLSNASPWRLRKICNYNDLFNLVTSSRWWLREWTPFLSEVVFHCYPCKNAFGNVSIYEDINECSFRLERFQRCMVNELENDCHEKNRNTIPCNSTTAYMILYIYIYIFCVGFETQR